jgi:D-alanine-D-alanine ligase-like ATP-grasp enzyme
LYPKLVEAAGISFADLCALLVETAVARPVKSQR